MFEAAISELTTARWELRQELAHAREHGFAAMSLWRPKLSDEGVEAAASRLARAGMRASSLQWAGGFTGSDGRSFRESIADAEEAIEAAAVLARASALGQPPVVIVYGGCRGGHTRSHATRLLVEALGAVVPVARREGVTLALKPLHPRAAPECGVLSSPDAALDIIDQVGEKQVGLALDLWHFGDVIMSQAAENRAALERWAAATVLVQVADRCGSPAPEADRQPAGMGCLPLETVVGGLIAAGYQGDFEFDPVGEAVEMLGYEGTLHQTRHIIDTWADNLAIGLAMAPVVPGFDGPGFHEGSPGIHGGERSSVSPALGIHRRAAATGSLRSQASSQTVSRG
jgi:sugar phosphate isomerase/epimerase